MENVVYEIALRDNFLGINKGLFINYVIQSGGTGGKPKDDTR